MRKCRAAEGRDRDGPVLARITPHGDQMFPLACGGATYLYIIDDLLHLPPELLLQVLRHQGPDGCMQTPRRRSSLGDVTGSGAMA